MADFQYAPEEADPVIQLRKAMDRMDGTWNILFLRRCADYTSGVHKGVCYSAREGGL